MSSAHARLIPHPRAPGLGEDFAVEASCAAQQDGGLVFRYVVTGAIEALLLAERRPPARVDGLWRHSCFEAFVAGADPDYLEFNYAPSGEWAAYAFANYRVAATELRMAAPRIDLDVSARRLVLTAIIAVDALTGLASCARYRIGLAAVLETRIGALGYYAAHHPAERPDFHDRGGFILSAASRGESA